MYKHIQFLVRKLFDHSLLYDPARATNLNASKSTISRIANKVGKQRYLFLLNSEKPKFRRRRRHRETASAVHRIAPSINKENPPATSIMAARYHISVGTTYRIIRDIIYARRRKQRLHSKRKVFYRTFKGSYFVSK